MKDLNKIDTWDELLALVAKGISEGPHLDFKLKAYWHQSKPPDKRERDKEELRRDATSFANSGGGILLIGVDEDTQQGRAVSVPGIEDAVKHENELRDVLSSFIEPPFTKTALRVRTVLDPQNVTKGVVIVEIGGCEPSLPHAVQDKGDAQLDFWIRTDKSKRRMTYLQLRASFLIGDNTIIKQSVDALAISEIHKIGYTLKDATRNDEEKTLELLEQLRFYVEEYRYGPQVQMEVMEAAGNSVNYPRRGISARVARTAVDLIEATVSSFHMWVPSKRKITEDQRTLLRQAASHGHSLAYDGAKYLQDLQIVVVGSELMGKVLRIAHLNNLDKIKEMSLDDIKVVRELAEERDMHDAVQVLDYHRDAAFEGSNGPYVPEPKALRRATLDLDTSIALRSSKKQAREKQPPTAPKSSRRVRSRSK